MVLGKKASKRPAHGRLATSKLARPIRSRGTRRPTTRAAASRGRVLRKLCASRGFHCRTVGGGFGTGVRSRNTIQGGRKESEREGTVSGPLRPIAPDVRAAPR